MRALYAFRPWDPTTYPTGIETRAPSTLASWLRFFPDAKSKDRDPEDWIENACILEAAEKAGLPLMLLESKGDMIYVSGGGWMAPDRRPGSPIGAMLGTWSNSDLMRGLPIDVDVVGSDQRAVRAAGDYATSATFLRHAGRPMAVAGGDVEGEGGLEAALRQVVDACGSGDVFIKTIKKDWSGRFSVDPASDRDLWQQLVDADLKVERESDGMKGYGLGWIPVQREGASSVLLIQGRIRPTYEYRIVVIDGRPVTGSGCIEAFTPAENTAVFDPQMEEIRSDHEVVIRPDLVERYLAFAEVFCHEFALERGEGLDYSLDVCIDAATGKVVPIELNPPLNLGAYARSTDAWLAAIVERTERAARHGEAFRLLQEKSADYETNEPIDLSRLPPITGANAPDADWPEA